MEENNKTSTQNEAENPFDLFRFGRHFIIPPLRKYYDRLLPLYNKISAEKWAYLFFGALTTVVSIVSFQIAFSVLGLSGVVSNTVSFILAVTFAYFVNKYYVFNSRKKGLEAVYEAVKFVGARLASFGIETLILFLLLDCTGKKEGFYAFSVKFIAQVIVFILNYVFSKLIVFTHKKDNGGTRKMFDDICGYWEEGYHYYIEIRDGKITVREYSKRIVLSANVSFKKDGDATELILSDNRLSYGPASVYAKITRLYHKDGQLFLEEDMNVVGERKYVLKKTDKGPFDNIVILDKELLPSLQGEWLSIDDKDRKVVISKDNLKLMYGKKHVMLESDIHVIEYRTNPGKKLIVSKDLTDRDFRGFTFFDICGNTISTRMIVCDAPSPMFTFVRKGTPMPKKEPLSFDKPDTFHGMSIYK